MSDTDESKKVDDLIRDMEQLKLELQKEKEKNKKKKEKEGKKIEKQMTPPLVIPGSSQGSGSQAPSVIFFFLKVYLHPIGWRR